MRAILGREFFSYARARRFFTLRQVAFGLPLLFLVLVLMVSGGWDQDTIGTSLFLATGYTIMAVTLLVTPAMLAHVLPEERRGNKLDVLRTAPISTTSIVLGKWLGRVGLLAMMLLAALPLNAAALLYGGVHPSAFPRLVAVVFLTLTWVSSLSLFIGRNARELGVAVRRAYVTVILWLTCTFVALCALPMSIASVGPGGSSAFLTGLGIGGALLNPFVLVLQSTYGSPLLPGSFLGLDLLAWHGIIVLLVSAVLLFLSLRALDVEPSRLVPVPQTTGSSGKTRREISRRIRRSWRPLRNKLLWADPITWLETRRGATSRGVMRMVLLLIVILGMESLFVWGLTRNFFQGDRYQLHLIPICVLLVYAFLSTASLGAAAIHHDNERNTREVLHATPIRTRRMARAKVRGVISGSRLYWVLALCHALLGFLMGDIPFLGVLLFAAVLMLLLYCLAAFSLFISFRCRSSTHANVKVLTFVVAHLFVWPVVGLILGRLAGSGSDAATGFFLGHHPVYLPAMVIAVGSDSEVRADGSLWVPCIFYFLYYAQRAHYFLSTGLPNRYRILRDGDLPLHRHPRPQAPLKDSIR